MKRFRKILTVFLVIVMLAGTATWVNGEDVIDLNKEMYEQISVFPNWLDWARLCNEIPDEYKEYFTDMLSLPYEDRGFLEITDIRKCADSTGLVVSLKGMDYSNITVKSYGSSGYDTLYRRTYVYAMIVDRETNTPVTVRNLGTMASGGYNNEVEEIRNINIRLPDNFDKEKHKVLFFYFYYFGAMYSYSTPEYIFEEEIDKFFDANDQVFAISEPIEADLSFEDIYGNGDANRDGKLNLADITLMLKYIAKWEIDGFSISHADVNCTGKIDMGDAVISLRRIAGWQNEGTTTKYYMDNWHTFTADEEYEERQIKYLNKLTSVYPNNKTASEIEKSLVDILEMLKHYGFSFEIIEECLLQKSFCQVLYEHNNWSRDDLIKFMREAYYTE